MLDHPRIVWILDHGVADGSDALAKGTPWLAMQRATGTLADLSPLSWNQQRVALVGLLQGLAHAHARGVVHLDVKPSNVLVGCRRHPADPLAHPTDGLCLADFGIARHAKFAQVPLAGTPRFMAPEQRQGKGPLGPWTDLYGVGCLAWALATGGPPRPGERPIAPAGVPKGWMAWVDRLWAHDPVDRFASAAAAVADLLDLGVAVGASSIERSGELGDLTTCAVIVPEAPEVLIQPSESRTPTVLRPLPATWQTQRVPWPSPSLVDAGRGLIGLRQLPFRGRVAACDRLWSSLASVSEDKRARVVVLRGASGVGVTRLGRWLVERSHEVGSATVLRGPTLLEAMQQWVAHVRSRLPDWIVADVGEGTIGPGLVRETLADAARLAPVVIWVDDVALDEVALESIRRHLAIQSVDPVPVLWVCGSRTEDAAPSSALAALEQQDDVETIELLPLEPSDHEALVADALQLDESAALWLADHTQGHPGLAVSLLQELVAVDALISGPDGFVFRPGVRLSTSNDQVTSWERRIAKVVTEPVQRRVLWLAAILGPVEALQSRLRTAFPGTDVVGLHGRLIRAGLATSDRERMELRSPGLRQALIFEAKRAGVAQELHRTALTFHPHDADNPWALERRAHHADGSGDAAFALACWLDAGESWRMRGAFRRKHRSALEAWKRVVDLGLPASDKRHARALALVVHSVIKGPGHPEHVAQCESLIEAAMRGKWPELEFTGRLFLGISLSRTDRYEEGISEMERAGELAARLGIWNRAVAAWSQLGHAMAGKGRFEHAERWFERCIEVAPRLADPAWPSDPAWAIVRGHCGLSKLARLQGQLDQALHHSEVAAGACEGINPQFRALADAMMSSALLALDRPAAAEPLIRRSIAYARRTGSLRDEVQYLALLTEVLLRQGRINEAEETGRRTLGHGRRGNQSPTWLLLGLIAMAKADWTGVAAVLNAERVERALLSAEHDVLLALLHLGVDLASGTAADGAERVDELRMRLERSPLTPSSLVVQTAEALRTHADQRLESSIDHFVTSLRSRPS